MLQFLTTSSLSRMLNILLDISFLPPFLPFFIYLSLPSVTIATIIIAFREINKT